MWVNIGTYCLTLIHTHFVLNGLKMQLGLLFVAVFNMGAANPGGMMPIQQQQQQHNTQGAFVNMAQNAQNLQSGMATLQSNPQNHPNFSQQRQQNQQ